MGYKYIPYPPSKKLLLDTGFLMHCMKYFFRIVYFVQVTLNKSLQMIYTSFAKVTICLPWKFTMP